MALKRVVFLIHGIGRHSKEWSNKVLPVLKNSAEALSDDSTTGFQKSRLKAAIDDTDFVELNYDELLQECADRMLEKQPAFFTALRASGFKQLADIWVNDSATAALLRETIFDLVIYGAMPEHRAMVRKHLLNQIMTKIAEYGPAGAEYSVIAHSLGTAVIHDTLHEMSSEQGSPIQLGMPFMIHRLFMLANVSASVKTDYDPLASNIRTMISGKQGYIKQYFDFSHELDPIARFNSYRDLTAGTLSEDRNTFASLSGIRSKNIHGMGHYLEDSKVHPYIFSGLYGSEVVPIPYRNSLTAKPSSDGAVDLISAALKESLKEWAAKGARKALDKNVNSLITIAEVMRVL